MYNIISTRYCDISASTDLSKLKHLVFDLDGTVYRGSNLFPYTTQALAILESCDVGHTYLTNNSSKSTEDYSRKIEAMGLDGDPDRIQTSAASTIDYLKRNRPEIETVFLLGTESLAGEFRRSGYEVLREADENREPQLVVVAFDTGLEYDRLCKASWWIAKNKPYVATHPDRVCPTDLPTVLVDCGAVCACIESATGRRPDKVFGKPDRTMIDGVTLKHGLAPDEIAMVGDRLYTDVEMARSAGVIGVLVLSGEATLDDLHRSDLSPEIVVDNILTLAEEIRAAKSRTQEAAPNRE